MKTKVAVLLRGYKIVRGLIPGFLPAATIRSAFTALLPFVNIVFTAMILNALVQGRELRYVLTLSVAAALINFIIQGIIHFLRRIINYRTVNIWNVYEKPLNEKQYNMDLELIEDPETRFLRQKIFTFRNTNGNGILPLYCQFQGLTHSLYTVIFSIIVFAPVFSNTGTQTEGGLWGLVNTPWFAVLLALFVVGNAVLGMILTVMNTKKSYGTLKGFHFPNMVRQFMYENLVTKYNMGKDIKIYGLHDCIGATIDDIISSTNPVIKKWASTSARYLGYGNIAANVLKAIVYIFVATKAVLGGLDLGSIVLYVGGITCFTNGFKDLVNHIMQLFSNMEALTLYFDFLDLPTRMYHGTLPVDKRADNGHEIEFHNVSFKYPGTDNYALKNINLKLNAAQRLAVVGMNGSGKTTMIKLLCRLYDPTEGEITLNGINIDKFRDDEYQQLFSVVFQDFKLYSFSLGQNVAANADVDEVRATDCLKKAGLTELLSVMKNGLNTSLYKDLDKEGYEISGGEAQKIALARALYKNAPIIVLDEPTAALDPIAESEIYSQFNEIVGEKTAVYISHRLSSCRFCDSIAVFHEGELVQRGSHDELVADEDGKYYELWNAQAQYYQ